MIIDLNEKKFEDLVSFWKLLVVEFWAPWCGPCKMMGPMLNELSKDFAIVKINVDDDRDLSIRYNVKSIPSILIFKNAELVKSFVGVKPLHILRSELDKLKVPSPITKFLK